MRARRIVIPALVAALFGAFVTPLTPPPAVAISQLDSIPVGDGPTAIELRPDGAIAFVANGLANTVSAITLSTQTVSTIEVGFGPADVRMRPGTSELWVTNYASGTISIVNSSTLTQSTFFSVSGAPQDIVFSADGSLAYVTFPLQDQVRVFTASTRALLTSYDVSDAPQGLALDAERNRLVIASAGSTATGDRITFLNLSNGATSSIVLTGDGTGVHIDAARDRAYVSMFGQGLVVVVNLNTDTVERNLNVGGQLNRMHPTWDNRLLLLAAGSAIVIIDLELGQQRTLYSTPTFTNDVVMALDGRSVYSTTSLGDAVSVARLEIDRYSGADRYQTAITMSLDAYPSTHHTVYLASGTSFPDALSLAPAIGRRNGPLLLNPAATLRDDVRAEILRLDPDLVVIGGGTGVISSTVEQQIRALGVPEVLRLSGANRYETSLRVVDEFFEAGDPDPDYFFLVTGRNFPDALSAGAAAAARTSPMLLVDGSASSLPSAVITRITNLNPDTVVIVGGTGVMSQGIRNQLVALGGPEVVRAAGADRYATSVAVTEIGFDYYTSAATYWATGANFPDALAGITLAAPVDAPIYLVRPTCLPSDVLHGAWRHNADRIGILGGAGAVSTAVQNLTRC